MSKLEQLLTQIAQSKLGIETLETRKSDSLDFPDVAVWCLRENPRSRVQRRASNRAARRRSRTRPTTDQEPSKPAESAWLHSRTARSSRHPINPPPRRSK